MFMVVVNAIEIYKKNFYGRRKEKGKLNERQIKLTYVSFLAHVKTAYRIVTASARV